MLDYRALEALFAVLELQSFEKAAKKLHITQSAVSQRIKGLETLYGEPVMIRTLPYRPTRLGGYLLGHYKKICLLEDNLEEQIIRSEKKVPISIAINRDSMEMCFFDFVEQMDIFNQVILEIIADDQELTIEYMKKGLVSACLSTAKKEIMGGNVCYLGTMEYLLVAAPSYIEKYFSHGDDKTNLVNAPAIKFDKNDHLHERYLEKYFGLKEAELSFNIIPSVKGFKKFAVLGYGYGLIPRIDILEELAQKQLVELYPGKVWETPLYWHYWSIETEVYRKFNAEFIHYMTNKLKS